MKTDIYMYGIKLLFGNDAHFIFMRIPTQVGLYVSLFSYIIIYICIP